uniref:Similar to Zea mays chromosome 422kDazein-associated intercluster region,copia-typepolpolyprotein n=1 Tax=Oryza sativa subsp. japonica TaxID=39947 RepID=Q9AYF2_ORYSJ|nr:Similar to Zea mays chromosome 422kDazein-associated intercluster region,copia-typepolpolyprotein [Oryza sativa Japonica Group]
MDRLLRDYPSTQLQTNHRKLKSARCSKPGGGSNLGHGGHSRCRESICGDGPGVGLGIRRSPWWSEIMRDTKARVQCTWLVKFPYGIRWMYSVRMECGVEFGRSPNLRSNRRHTGGQTGGIAAVRPAALGRSDRRRQMQSYIMAEDYDIWRKVSHPYVVPERINIAALKTDFEQNSKAHNILLSGISRSDYDCVSHLQTAHEIWIALNHFRSRCPKLGRARREDNGDEKTNDKKPKGTFKGRKIKETLNKAFDQVYAAFKPLSDVDGDSRDEDKGKNISSVCFMACGESDSGCEDNEWVPRSDRLLSGGQTGFGQTDGIAAYWIPKFLLSSNPSTEASTSACVYALVARKENVWIVDSGCSRHMTGDKNWFSSLKKASKTESIIFGDASTSVVLAKVSQIVDEDFEVHFKKTGSKVFDSCGDSVLNISRYGRVFKADFDNHVSPAITCLVAKFDKDVMFWHRRLGHVGFDHLTRLSGLDLVRGLPKLKKDLDLVCTPCRHAKMVASSHAPIVFVMVDALGQLLHMDIVDPARVQSVGGKWYVLVIVDDFSSYSWVFFMATKDEAFQHFRGLFLRLDLEFPGSLKRIRSDNGGTLSQVQGEDSCIFEDDSDDDDDKVGSAGQTGRQAGQTASTPPGRPPQDERSNRPGSSGSGSVDADRDCPPEATTSTSTGTERETTLEVAATLHIQRRHPPEQIIGNLSERTTRSKITTHDVCANSAFVASFEPKDVSHALIDESWINAMHEELENFKRNKVWTLVESPSGHNIIGTKWVFKNKQNEDGLIVRNKARLVAQGFTQVEGLDFGETFDPVARIEAIRLLLAFAASKGFKLYQMDIYVEDIIFSCSTHALVVEFAETVPKEFEMSMMASPGASHRQAVKRIMRYLNHTLEFGIWKQSSVAQSIAESEYVAAANCCSQILWLISTLKDYDLTFEKVPLFCDNTSAINIAKNPVQHSRTKHIDIRFHFLRDHIEK